MFKIFVTFGLPSNWSLGWFWRVSEIITLCSYSLVDGLPEHTTLVDQSWAKRRLKRPP